MLEDLNGHLVFAIAAAVLGSGFQHGYHTGVVSNIEQVIKQFISRRDNLNYTREGEGYVYQDKVRYIYTAIISVFLLGGMIGSLMTAFVAGTFGRKNSLIWNNLFVFISAGLMTFSKACDSYVMLIAGRFFIGVNAGLNSGLAPMYLTEISPVRLRGAIGTIYQLVITISILISSVLGLKSLLGTDDRWPILFALMVIPAIFMVLSLPFCPESPKHLLINQGKEVQAQKALVWLRETEEVQDEMIEMKVESESMKQIPKVTFHDLITQKQFKTPLIIVLVVMMSQQLSGINAVIFYSTSIFTTAGLAGDKAQYATLGMTTINVIMTVVSVFLIERLGRRTLLISGLFGCGLCTLILTICLIFKEASSFLSYISILAVYVYIISFASGLGSIPWFYVSELFEAGPRAMAATIAVAVNWSANISVGFGFENIEKMIGSYVFIIFTVLLTTFLLFTWKKVPETKGKTVEEITAKFKE